MTTIQRILYATHLSAASEPAWDEARRLGRLLGAEILLLHVVPPPPFLPIEGYVPPQMYQDLLGSARRDAQEQFDRLLGSVAGSGLKTRVRPRWGPGGGGTWGATAAPTRQTMSHDPCRDAHASPDSLGSRRWHPPVAPAD